MTRPVRALQGYQAGPRRAAEIGAAIYEALRELRIDYVGNPASFEETGQKIRTTAAVLRERLGNCIDLSITYAACLEAAGLHPLVWITEGTPSLDSSWARTVSPRPSHSIRRR